jgi:hypothetical protein
MNDKIFFLHIPKTAGTAFNEIFKGAVPGGRFFQHMESRRSLFLEVIEDGGPFFASGHFMYRNFQNLVTREDIFSITILRNPVQQLISHLKWVKAYGNPDDTERRKTISENIAKLAIELWKTNLNDVNKLKKIFDRPIGKALFDNLQTRYLSSHTSDAVTKEVLDSALNNFKSFNFIFILDDIANANEFLSKKFDNIGNLTTSNVARIDESVDLSDKKVLDFYRLAVRFDAVLFTEVRKYSRERFFSE